MVLVFMSDDDTVQITGAHTRLMHASLQFFAAQPDIDEDARSHAADHDGIAFGTTGQSLEGNGHPHPHNVRYVSKQIGCSDAIGAGAERTWRSNNSQAPTR
jgi:hypothetical protein